MSSDARLLESRALQQVLRWVATGLAFAGVGCDAPPAARRRPLPVIQPTVDVEPVVAPEGPDSIAPFTGLFPDAFGETEACTWLRFGTDAPPSTPREHVVAALDAPELAPLFATEPPEASSVVAALSHAEHTGLYLEILAAQAFKQSRPRSGRVLIELLARIEHHARMAIALRRAQALTAPVPQRPWLSKAGPPPCGVRTVPADFVPAARKAYESGDAGTWDKDGRLALRVVSSGGLVLWRRGKAYAQGDGTDLAVRRLDVLAAGSTAATLEHAWLGRVTVPPGATLSTWNTAEHLAPEARAVLRARVKAAADGDRQALDTLDGVLPAARTFIEAELAARPDAPGAPALRMQLTLLLE